MEGMMDEDDLGTKGLVPAQDRTLAPGAGLLGCLRGTPEGDLWLQGFL